MSNRYSLFINTCDAFEDCWNPFFKLFSIYWPDYKGKIYLNTEYKEYSYPGLDIVCTKVCATNEFPKNKRATWSQCLKWALDSIDTDIILYLQEDYFLSDQVKNDSLNYFFDLMTKTSEIPCIQLTQVGIPAIKKSSHELLYSSDVNFFSYVCCQASLWRKDVMLSLIREHETAWNFEWWGSKRAKYMGLEFLVVDPNQFSNENNIIPYLATGVIGGKWYAPVVELFKKHQIEMDFEKRGFCIENLKPTLEKRIKTKLSIWKMKSVLEVYKMAYFKQH